MRRRGHRRREGDDSDITPSVLSTPSAGVHANAHSSATDRSEAGSTKRRGPDRHLGGDGVINAYWQKGNLVLVMPDATTDNGIRFRRLKAEHSCFIKHADIPDPVKFYRMLTHHHAVRKAVWEGSSDEWLRVTWQDREALKHYCKALHTPATDPDNERAAIPTYEGMVSPVLRHMVDNDLRPVKPRRVWVDLETDSRVSFSRAIEGEARILSWATEDEHGNREHAMLEEDTDEAEAILLQKLWAVFEHYDQILAWGGDRFDFPIIKHRSERHKLLRGAVREWRRWLWLDHLALYRRMNMAAAESGDEKTSFALNAVAVALGVGEKDDFDSSKTWEAWVAGGISRQRLMEYNIQDTALMPLIEAKTGFIELLQTIADTCGTFADSRGVNPGVQVEGFLARLAHERGHKFPTVLKPGRGDKYEGAYVIHPEKKAGVHRGVHVCDFASLYPACIISWNMSPETILADDEVADAHAAYSPLTKQSFDVSHQGILPLAVTQLLALRKEWNDRKAEATPGTDEWKDADRRSGAYKITANSFYGVIGAPTSRHYDRRVAESVAQCGKYLILETQRAAEERRMKVIYGDTDSLFVVGASREEFEEFVAWANAELYPRLLEELGCPTNLIKLAYEKEFDRLIITTAKKYVGSYVHYKGTLADETSKPEIKGLEFKRGDSLRITRRMQEEIAYRLVGYQSDEDPDDPFGFEEVNHRWMRRVMEDPLDLDDIAINKRLNKPLSGPDGYKANQPHIRIAKEMEGRGEDVGEGARITYIVTGAADSPQTVCAAPEYDPITTEIDREALWEKLIWPASKRLMETAFPNHDWRQFQGMVRKRKAAEAKARREVKKAATVAHKAPEKAAHVQPDNSPPPRRRRRPALAEAPPVDDQPLPRRRRRRPAA